MQALVTITRDIKVPPEWVWEKISLVGGVQHWMPGVKDCRLEGRGIGAHRLCQTDMGWIREVIENIEHNEKIFEYSVSGQGIYPFIRFNGRIQVFEKPDNYSAIRWEGKCVTKNENVNELSLMLKGLFEKGINGLEQLYFKTSKSSVLL